jgi:hypothetical protein
MNVRVWLTAAATLGACLSAPQTSASAAAPQSPSRDCFNTRQITGYNIIDEHNVGVRVGAQRHYVFSTTWNARDLDWTFRIAVHSPTRWICTGDGLGVEVSDGRPNRMTFPISSITRAPEEPPANAAPSQPNQSGSGN